MPLALAIPAIIGGVSSIGGAAIASSGAKAAANTQAQAANYAANLQSQATANALAEQQRQFNTNQQNIQPWLQTGMGGLANLSYLLGIGGQNGGYPTSSGGYQNTNIGTRPATTGYAADSTIGGGRGYQAMQTLNENPTPQQVDAYAAQGRNAYGQVIAPTGGGAGVPLSSMVNPQLGGFGSLMQPFGEQFQAPTAATEQNDPGYQFRLSEGQKLLQNSAASRGGLLSGGTAKALTQYGQNFASNEYGNVYNRALGEYQQRYNIYNQDQNTQYNRLASLSGVGQTAASQLGALGANSANQISNIIQTGAANQGMLAQNAGAARASGYQNSGNIWGNAFSGIGNNLANLYQYSQMNKQPGNSLPAGYYPGGYGPPPITPINPGLQDFTLYG